MQIVIDIDEKLYDNLKTIGLKGDEVYRLLMAVKNGIILLRGHGRLVDADKSDDTIIRLNEDGWDITRNEYKLIDRVIFELPTVIEAEADGDDDNG